MVDMIQDAQEDLEEDSEGREWEEAQIRRGEQRRVHTSDARKPAYRPTPSELQSSAFSPLAKS